ncbi:MAG: hypothetical protein ACI8WB_004906, partial [Phenylobacterium sp.]
MIKLPPTIGLLCALLLSTNVMAKKCEGTLLVESNPAELIEEYANRVRVYLPLKVLLSEELANCADEIEIEAIDGNKIVFAGPNINKNGKLMDNQFNKISVKKGLSVVDVEGRTTQM